jgi:hypothetical protein
MNPVYMEVGALGVLAIVALLIAWKVSVALDAFSAPFRRVSEMQRKLMDAQKEIESRAIAVQQESSNNSLIDPFRAIAGMQQHADRSALKLDAALDLYNNKIAELEHSREAFLGELAHLKQATHEVEAARDRFQETAALLTGLDQQMRANHRESLSRLDVLSTQQSLDHLQKSVSEGMRQLLVRDLSRSATKFPRCLRVDLVGSGVETLGKVDGGEFLASLRKVKFQLVCEVGNCDGKGRSYLSEGVYEVKQPSFFVGTLRKATGSTDPPSYFSIASTASTISS